MQKIIPCLWFNDQCEEAINLYCSIFQNSKIVSITRYPESMPEMKGKVLTAIFQLEGMQYMALDGGPLFKFTEAVSFQVTCETQEEIDDKWNKLLADGGQESQCGWLKDKFGLSWQITPPILGELLNDPDRVKANRVMAAMMKMRKIDIATLKKAYDQE